jgi:hypothetical protein
MVRASFGCYNEFDDIDRLVEMVARVARGEYAGEYRLDRATGEYLPAGYSEPLADFFVL